MEIPLLKIQLFLNGLLRDLGVACKAKDNSE